MAYCQQCGAEISGGGRFCPSCGAGQVASGARTAKSSIDSQGLQQLQGFWDSLPVGQKVLGIAALVSAIAFFLPAYDSGYAVTGPTIGGSWWFHLLWALALLGTVYLHTRAPYELRPTLFAVQAAIAMIYGRYAVLVFQGNEYGAGYAFGFHLMNLGFLVAAGAAIHSAWSFGRTESV